MSKSDPFAAPSRMYATSKPEAPAEETVTEEVEETTSVPSGTIAEIREWVGDDVDRAQEALEAERASDHPRVTLIEYLEDKVGA